jgi:hypothetical protein
MSTKDATHAPVVRLLELGEGLGVAHVGHCFK